MSDERIDRLLTAVDDYSATTEVISHDQLDELLMSEPACDRTGCDSPATHLYRLHIEMAGIRFPVRSGCRHVVPMCLQHGNDEFVLHLLAFKDSGYKSSCRLCHESFADVTDICRSLGEV